MLNSIYNIAGPTARSAIKYYPKSGPMTYAAAQQILVNKKAKQYLAISSLEEMQAVMGSGICFLHSDVGVSHVVV